MGLGLGFGLENKDQKEIKGTTKPLMANLDITREGCGCEGRVGSVRGKEGRGGTCNLRPCSENDLVSVHV